MNRSQFKLLRSIASGMFSIHPSAVQAYLPLAIQYMNGEIPEQLATSETEDGMSSEAERFLNQFQAFRADAKPFGVTERDLWYYDNYPIQSGSVVFIPILAAITQEDNCYQAGTKTIMGWYERAEADETVKAIVEVMNSPGGEVFGTRTLADYKANMSKPIVGFCEGMQCSAGQYIAASNSYQFAANDTMVGCIGVMTNYQNFSKYYAKMGIDIREVYSKTSPRKNEDTRAAARGDFSLLENGILYSLDQEFMDFVAKYRPDISAEALEGATFIGKQGIEAGIIDEIGTLADAYNKALELAKNSNQTINYTQMKKVLMKVPSTMIGAMKLLGATEVEEETIEEETSEEVETIEEETSEEETEDSVSANLVGSLQAEVTKLTARLSRMETALQKTSTAGTRSVARLKGATEAQADEAPAKKYVTAAQVAGGTIKVIEKRKIK